MCRTALRGRGLRRPEQARAGKETVAAVCALQMAWGLFCSRTHEIIILSLLQYSDSSVHVFEVRASVSASVGPRALEVRRRCCTLPSEVDPRYSAAAPAVCHLVVITRSTGHTCTHGRSPHAPHGQRLRHRVRQHSPCIRQPQFHKRVHKKRPPGGRRMRPHLPSCGRVQDGSAGEGARGARGGAAFCARGGPHRPVGCHPPSASKELQKRARKHATKWRATDERSSVLRTTHAGN